MNQEINVLALVKGEERYVFLYDDAHRAAALRTLGRFASNPDLSFSWYDAAVLSQKIRQMPAVETNEAAAPSAVPQPHSRPRFNYPLAADKKNEE